MTEDRKKDSSDEAPESETRPPRAAEEPRGTAFRINNSDRSDDCDDERDRDRERDGANTDLKH